jgi:pilus assembly protein CpaF
MSLRQILARKEEVLSPQSAIHTIKRDVSDQNKLKQMLHGRLLEELDLGAMESLSENQIFEQLTAGVEKIIKKDQLVINQIDLLNIVKDLKNEIFGLGPLEPLLADKTISDILVNTCSTIFVERAGRLELVNYHFDDNAHLLKTIEKIVARIGRRIDESSPMVDARLADGSRVNAIVPPLALDGPALSIRRFSEVPYTMENLISFGTLTHEMALILAALVRSKINILVSGGTGSGKTTLLNIMSGFIPDTERIITIEDAAELRLQQVHVVRLETRPPNLEGKGEINQRALVKNSLRMRPDRIVVGEVRGAEVLDMLQAMNTGHDGSLTTIHANSSRDALTRIENMVGLTGLPVVQKSLRQQIASAISVVIHTARLSDGKRKVMSIDEITGLEADVVTMQEIYSYKQSGVEPDGRVIGKFMAAGIRPRFADTVAARGSPLSDSLFLRGEG